MIEQRIKINSIIENQLPEYVREEFPLVSEFLSQYYLSLESQGGPYDLIQNIDKYIKIDNLTNLVESTKLQSDLEIFDDEIVVESTLGFPERYGLLKIDDEIITYTGISTNKFVGCVRGFSGISSYTDPQKTDQLIFSSTSVDFHFSESTVQNLSILFLKQFFKKVKTQIVPGLENQEFYSELNESLFIKQSNDFYSSKGTDSSFKILFGALYGKIVDVIRPRDYLIQPSDADYRIVKRLIVEPIEGNPINLINSSLFQDEGYFKSASGTISGVERIVRNSKEYFILNLDYDYNRDINVRGTTRGEFSIHPKTLTVSNIESNSSNIDVDSTVGFANSGELVINLENNINLLVTYEFKSLNQFFGCSGIIADIPEGTEIKLNDYAYGYYGSNRDQLVKVRVTGVLEGLDILDKENAILYQKNNNIEIETLGNELEDIKANTWFFNIPINYNIKNINAVNLNLDTYNVELFDEHSFVVGDNFSINGIKGKVSSIVNNKIITINPNEIIDVDSANIIKKELAKVNSTNYPELKIYNANVQNVYSDNLESYYVSSPSLPNYLNQQLNVKDGTISLSVEINGEEINLQQDHFFYSGECVVFKETNLNSSNLQSGVYYIKRLSSNSIKLSRSRENIFSNQYIKIAGFVSGTISFFDFNDSNLNLKRLEPQNILRKISDPINENKSYRTDYGFTGIFVNGVELLNYKSKDKVFYGPIEDIFVVSPGSGYDVINPPILSIADTVGVGASAYCTITGSLERFDIVDPGFDYIEQPIISITGGNGTGATAEVNLVGFEHIVYFNSENTSLLDFNNRIIGFSTHHKFKNYEEVIYDTQNQSAIIGLNSNLSYFVKTVGVSSIQLYKSINDALSGINTINFTFIGKGVHAFKSIKKKKKIGSISVKNPGSNYSNKKRIAFPVGINTASDVIIIKNHGYESGEIVKYDATNSPISGLSSSASYYVTKINNNEFKLSQLGITTDQQDYFYRTNQYINLKSEGNGKHIFNYPPIEISIVGRIGIETSTGQSFSAIVNPIFRGKIDSIFLESGGSSYGSEDIINYNRQPSIDLLVGSSAEIIPIVSDSGSIIEVTIQSGGSGYYGIPSLQVNGDGRGAVLVPIVTSGRITDVKIIFGGGGYSQNNTFVNVIPAGSGAKFESSIKTWEINLVQRVIVSDRISDDEGVISASINPNFGLEYSHLYAASKLRSSLYSVENVGGISYLVPDIENDNPNRIPQHSPLIGWAYDGNPIYGPYGYSSPRAISSVKSLSSGYSTKTDDELNSENRPSFNIYPSGFFVDDFKFNFNGDLDENNGRFCVTPEFPNGTYAYFSTLNEFKQPQFPYVIGKNYKSRPIDFNFEVLSNQENIDLNKNKWIRNTKPYNLTKTTSGYDYIFNSNTINSKISIISNVLSGSISNIGIVTSGFDYQVNDKIIFDNEKSEGRSAYAFISKVKGKEITQISTASTFFDNVEFIPSPIENSRLLGFATVPHDFNNNDIISITGNYDYNKKSLIKISNNSLIVATGIGSTQHTGLVTYFNVSGIFNFPYIRENDVYKINNEEVKILNVDKKSSRIRVLRNIKNISGITSYTSGSLLTEKTRKFEVSIGVSSDFYNYKTNKEIYFDPKESLLKGTSGISSTIYFSNAGVGKTYVTAHIKSIYIPNHNLNTGEELIYSNNNGSSIVVSFDGLTSSPVQNGASLYVVKINEDLIGLSTNRISIGSSGEFVGIGTTLANTLFFVGDGLGVYHSFKTNYDGIFSARITNNVVTVSTSSSHGLGIGDSVDVNIKPGITTTVFVKYNDYNRRMTINERNIESISLLDSTLKITNHGYQTGEKVIYNSGSLIGGLLDNQIYYVIVISENIIKLSSSFHNATKNKPITVEFLSFGTGTISQVNPQLKVIDGQTVVFDLSSPTLSYTSNSIKSAFEFNLYEDSNFSNKFEFSNINQQQIITKLGRIGVDNFANLTLKINDNTPKKLYYNLIPINFDDNLQVKKDIITDFEQINNNLLSKVDSVYSGTQQITGIGTNTFKYNLPNISKEFENLYTTNNSTINYKTSSNSAFGGISEIKIENFGKDYIKIPSVKSIDSVQGENAILNIESKNIGLINKTNLKNIGYNYSSDLTIRPKAKIPQIFEIDSLAIFDSIDVASPGTNYTSPPDLVVIDGFTKEIVDDVQLKYNIKENKVKIIKNTRGISNIPPKIIPINNTNGVGINSIFYDEVTKNVSITVNGTFSSPSIFPFSVGDEILIENVNVFFGKGYNSENYNYETFKILEIGINNIGVTTNPSITYNIGQYLIGDETPGTYNDTFIIGSVVSTKNIVSFNPVLTKFPFLVGEKIYSMSENFVGLVDSWDLQRTYLYVLTNDSFLIGDSIIGNTSKTIGRILDIKKVNSAFFNVSSSSIVKNGWESETGFLNYDLQRMPDNDYYQYFSYSLKSEIEFNEWNDIVSNLNHTAGFKKFSNLLINSSLPGISTDGIPVTYDSLSDIFVDVESFADVNCRTDFDYVAESSVEFPSGYRSNQIYFQNILLKDYFEMIGNRVILLDDISINFDNSSVIFDIRSNSIPVFKRDFVGFAVSVSDNSISIPNHFFVTGEEISYQSPIDGDGIEILPTNIPGIGMTDKLPSTVYVVKDNDSTIRVSASSTDSLLIIPNVLQIASVGTGTTHYFISKNQNSKCLITIDNIIQSPIVSTSVTTSTNSFVGLGTNIISVSGITSIFSGNLIKIDDEYMKVLSAYDNDIIVVRNILGSTLTSHNTGSLVTKIKGNYNIVDNALHFSGPPIGDTPIETELPDELDFSGITTSSSFAGRVFIRSGIPDTDFSPYSNNYIFDDISNQFDGLKNDFIFTSNKENVVGFSTGNCIVTLNGILQSPNGFNLTRDFSLEEQSGITTLSFTGTSSSTSYDVNNANVPRGGVIISVGSTQGFGYQPLVSAGGTSIVSVAGTIANISIGNSGSGYRAGLQTVKVGIKSDQNITIVGIASILNGHITNVNITNPGSGYTSSNPPDVIFDSPLPYSDIPLIYSSSSSAGVGIGAKVNIIVNQESKVLSFELSNFGYGYKIGEILTVDVGGNIGIPTTDTNLFNEFQISIDRTYSDEFSGWYFGDLRVFDPLDRFFNETRKSFAIRINNVPQTITVRTGSNLIPQNALLVFVNDVLQIPEKNYTFNGSFITFLEAPKAGDKSKVIFYEGTSSLDIRFDDIEETIKIGDEVTLFDDNLQFSEDERVVFDIKSPVILETNVYSGPGINTDESYLRTLTWCLQEEDKIINSQEISKNRMVYEPKIYPITNIISNVGIVTTQIFVDSVKTFFDNKSEGPTYDVILQSQDSKIQATAVATLSNNSILSITVTNPGFGYTIEPNVVISNPIGFGSTATANATISPNGQVVSISVINSGSGYTSIPDVIIEPPTTTTELITDVEYEGDFGIITGIQTTIFEGSNALIFDFYIPDNSFLKDPLVVGIPIIGKSGISSNYYFTISNSNVGSITTSKTSSGSTIGISSFLDNVYQASAVSIAQTNVPGKSGLVEIIKVTTKADYSGLSGIGYSNYYGNYSWGRIFDFKRNNPKSFDAYNSTGYIGINTSPLLYRYSPLKYQDYIT